MLFSEPATPPYTNARSSVRGVVLPGWGRDRKPTMATLDIQSTLAAGAPAGAGGVHVLHSHHYHSTLLRVLHEAEDIDGPAILAGAAAAAGMAALSAPGVSGQDAKIAWIRDRIGGAGLGRLDATGIGPSGEGKAVVHGSYFASAWSRRYPLSSMPVCAATGGFLSAAITRAYGRSVEARETACAAEGAAACSFRLRAAEIEVPGSGRSPVAQAGAARSGAPGPVAGDGHGGFPVGDLIADDSGSIGGAGGPFVRLPADFYASVTQLFEQELPRIRGPKFGNLPGILLLETAHRNGFHLFGELLGSSACVERFASPNSSAEDRFRLMVAAIEALGWGSWDVVSFVSGERLIVQIRNSYEALAHQRLFGRAEGPRCSVARGAAAALMNLLFRGPGSGEVELTTSLYNEIFRSPATFRAVETRCRAVGDPFCEIIANPLTV